MSIFRVPLWVLLFLMINIACDDPVTKPKEQDQKINLIGLRIDQMIDQSIQTGGETAKLKEFGDYCSTNADCLSGFCVPDGRDSICSQLCLADCPTGWNCKGISNTGSDTTFVCFKDDARICRLCIGDDDCPKGLCYELDGQSVCGTDCESDVDCASGYQCINISKDESVPKLQCVPKNQSCSCDQTTDGNLRICEVKNEFGTCIGRETCEIQTGWSTCDAQSPIAEICNQIDDNCDGLTDNILGLGEICTKDTQINGSNVSCTGRLICSPGQAEPICTAQAPQMEKCNFLDDDCDGKSDETFENRDQVCVVGIGQCQRFGVYACSNNGDLVECNVQAGQATQEICDGLDNDCDGLTDEDYLDLGRLCEVGVGACRKFGTNRCSDDHLSVICSEVPSEAQAEKCDGLDNDCDGSNDEDYPEVGQICTAGEGLCKQSSLIRCTDDQMGTICEVEAGLGQVEKCDGLDNDCDGYYDEEFVLLGQACSVGFGACERRGLFICESNRENVICSVTEGLATAELCDGLDNDCDLNTDEGYLSLGETCAVGVGLCRNVGVNRCALDGQAVICSASASQPTLEKCDQQDNDCDGRVDNGFEGVGSICEVGIGLCRKVGVKACSEQGDQVICNANPNEPQAEKCDGLDNDCDGNADEDFPEIGQICTAGQGACRQSSITLCRADGNGTECLVNAGNATAEKCDSLDNDCDGFTDEDFPNLSSVCVRGVGACERRGIMICDQNNIEAICSVEAGIPSNEKCDALDNDCDGKHDEDFADLGQICSVGLGQCYDIGLKFCKADGSGVECSATIGQASNEKCDALDNDCNGIVDDGFNASIGQLCSVGIGMCKQVGVIACLPNGEAGCNAMAGNAVNEKCDGLDNDCDGHIDESFPTLGQLCTAGQGACRQTSITVCKADGSATECLVNAGSATPEQCDSLDNDCDGKTDEDFTDLSSVCVEGIGACERRGIMICDQNNISTICSVQAGIPSNEKCDALDNDCDGKHDEDFAELGQICSVGLGQCYDIGLKFCKADGSGVECSATIGQASTEKCDALDNDCNGIVDDGFNASIGQLCSVGIGMCKQVGVIACLPNGEAGCNAMAGNAVNEKCDGLDNDCDGHIDESFPTLGQLCTAGQGACRQTSITVCKADGSATECLVNAGSATPEQCDYLDNDCDGKTDEDFATLSNTCVEGIGVCERRGLMICDPNGASVKCSVSAGQSNPIELCDSLDNDCDGKTDEGFNQVGEVCQTGVGACQQFGVYKCSADGSSIACTVQGGDAFAEKCDGLDNDCDSKIDESFASLGQVCTTGVGLCKNVGTIQCSLDGSTASCNANAGLPVAEKCDGADNDCDGKTDESFASLGQVCSSGVGLCKNNGTIQCSIDGLSASCTAIADLPENEKCDGADNDCDGKTDETFASIGQVCSSGVGLCKNVGTIQCSLDGSTASCNANASLPVAEKCDGADNDCDGKTDESFANIGQVCSTGIGLCLQNGTIQCSLDGSTASCNANAGLPVTEKCDSGDNDCDGKTDESFANLNQVCSVGVGECIRLGRYICSQDNQNSICSVQAGNPINEICDGLDNDCDSKIDETWPTKGQSCNAGQGICRRSGIFECNPLDRSGALICSATTVSGNAQELCDYQDDDCDGKTDEVYKDANGIYSLTTQNCGACDSNCQVLWQPNPEAFGVIPNCQISGGIAQCGYTCIAGRFDADGLSANGCELIPDADAIYVATTQNGGQDLATCGLLAQPCASITQGLARSVATNKPRIRVGEGVYREQVTLIAGKELLGGHQRNNWLRNPTITVSQIDSRGIVSADAHRYGVIAQQITTPTILDGFSIISGTPMNGGNSYGVYIKDSNAQLIIRNNRITAGDGGRGTGGQVGNIGTAGSNGNPGLNNYKAISTLCGNPANGNIGILGGTGGQRTCNGNVVNGGVGAWSSCGPYDTQNGPGTNGLSPAGLGGIAGSSAYIWEGKAQSNAYSSCSVPKNGPKEGSNGGNGGNGTDSLGASANNNQDGQVLNFHWQGSVGNSGGNGTDGGGGGGGGSAGSVVMTWLNNAYDIGASGGGGGSGGCGGIGGIGGKTGGGSFGVFITYSVVINNINGLPIITGNTITRGFGGRGGDGGNGGPGGAGGTGGAGGVPPSAQQDLYLPSCALQAGAGGTGGRGGHGSGGAGGNGGISYDLYISGVQSVSIGYEAVNTFTLLSTDTTYGEGGVGGSSSNVNIGIGQNGLVGKSGRILVR